MFISSCFLSSGSFTFLFAKTSPLIDLHSFFNKENHFLNTFVNSALKLYSEYGIILYTMNKTLNAYNFNSKHSQCTDTYEKINGADLYGMLHFFNFYLVRENPKTPKYIL